MRCTRQAIVRPSHRREDDDDLATMVDLSVRALWPHCRVIIVGDGEQALRTFAAEPPDVVILDVMMPPDGFEVCRRIRQASAVPILMLTARGASEDRERAIALGATDYLTKPFEPHKLYAWLRARFPNGEVAVTPR